MFYKADLDSLFCVLGRLIDLDVPTCGKQLQILEIQNFCGFLRKYEFYERVASHFSNFTLTLIP